jgi:hypothetical protein
MSFFGKEKQRVTVPTKHAKKSLPEGTGQRKGPSGA